ncbi:PAS domain S-box protein [Chlorobaculum sp. 24CR]|uniref:sensor histidine kinase n=1 Tax=Chlorobaculum sp. 24CR TaxID=2508878 RepID=UPI00100B304B|nr:sensor histidine kinase [Chlorobaculum sp. 24CR]RXK84324.1 PAS domain S-box protein [Chlorobaculum sp. 24CR]
MPTLVSDEQTIDLLIELIPDAVAVVDCEGKLLGANKAFYSRLGKKPARCTGKPLASLISSSPLSWPQADNLAELLPKACATGKAAGIVHPLPQTGEAERKLLVTLPLAQATESSPDDDLTKLADTDTGIDSASTEQELLEHKERISFALDAARSGIWEWNAETDRLMWSEEVWALYGLTPGSRQLNHELCVITVHEEDRDFVRTVITDTLHQGRAASVEYRVVHPADGSVHWLLSQGSPKYDANGKIVKYIGLITDITERKAVETTLLENKARLDQALEAAGAGIWEWDLIKGDNVWSDEVWRLYGLEPHGQTPSFALWAETIVHEDREATCQAVRKAATEGGNISIEYRVRYPDGSIHWLLSRGKPRKGRSGAIERYLGTIIDITRQKTLEEKLVKNEARMALALEATKAGVWEWNLKNDEVYWSDRIWRLYGLTPDSKPHNHKLCESTVHPDDREETFGIVMEAANREINIDIEFRVCHPEDGSLHWLACRGKPQLNEAGELDRYVGTVMDITERKRLDDELRENERKFRSIFDNAPIAISIKEIETGSIIDVNDSWLELLGYSLEEVTGKTGLELGLHHHESDYHELLATVARRERVCNKPLLLNEKNGDLVDVLYSTEFIELEGAAVLLVMMVDITLEKMQQQNISRLEQSIADRNIQLQKEVERLHRFLSMISHEYRTPLAIMRTNLDLIKIKHKMGKYSNNQEFAKIERSIARLVEVLEVSIQESRMADRHKSLTNRHKLPLATIIKSQVDTFSGIWKERTLVFENCPENINIYGEESGIKFAIFNLLDNARKYSPEESTITIKCFSKNENSVKIVVGNKLLYDLSTEELEMFFEKYHRGSHTSNTAGAGLGLWLVKNIVTQHDGSITLGKTGKRVEAAIILPVIIDNQPD